MKKLGVSTTLILLCFFGYTQPGFNKNYAEAGTSENIGVSVLPTSDGGYIVCGLGYAYVDSGWESIEIFKTDSFGNFKWMKIIGQPFFGYYCGSPGSFTVLSDGNYAFGGGNVDSSGALGQAILCKVDTSGDTIWLRRFGVNAYDNFEQTKETADKGFISVGWKAAELPAPYIFYAVKTDSNGNELWDSTYGTTGDAEGGYTVEQTADNGFIMGGSNNAGTNGQSQPFVVKTDSNGTVQWQQVYNNPNVYNGPAGVTQSRYGGYYMWGYMDTLGNSSQIYLNKLDPAGNIIWKHLFNNPSNPYVGQVRELADSSIVVVGGKNLPNDPDNDEAGWIVKVNNLGNELWERYYPGAYVNNRYFDYQLSLFYDFQPTADKGFIITGSFNDTTTNDTTYNQDFWLVKTDSMGCINGDCGYEGINAVQNNSLSALKIYPNPAQNMAVVEWQPVNGQLEVSVTDLLGREIQFIKVDGITGTTQLDISALANGFYVVRLLSPAGGGVGGGSAKLTVIK